MEGPEEKFLPLSRLQRISKDVFQSSLSRSYKGNVGLDAGAEA